MSNKKEKRHEYLHSAPGVFGVVPVAHVFSFPCCVFVLFVLYQMLPVTLWIVHSWLFLRGFFYVYLVVINDIQGIQISLVWSWFWAQDHSNLQFLYTIYKSSRNKIYLHVYMSWLSLSDYICSWHRIKKAFYCT